MCVPHCFARALAPPRLTCPFPPLFRQAFFQFDEDRSGFIDKNELRNLCEWVGQDVSENDLNEMMAIADGDGSGQIDFWEFSTLMAHKMGDTTPDRTLHAAFSVFDTDGSGNISADEIRGVMREMGESVSEKDIQNVLGGIDLDGDGNINYEEFAQAVTKEMQESGHTIV